MQTIIQFLTNQTQYVRSFYVDRGPGDKLLDLTVKQISSSQANRRNTKTEEDFCTRQGVPIKRFQVKLKFHIKDLPRVMPDKVNETYKKK